jgi:hypothetical protein
MTWVVSFDMVAVFYPMIVFRMKNPASNYGGGWFGFEGLCATLLARTGMNHIKRCINVQIAVKKNLMYSCTIQ